MTRTFASVVSLTLLGCSGDRSAEVIQLVPTEEARSVPRVEAPPVTHRVTAPVARSRPAPKTWSLSPPRGEKELRLERVDIDRLRVSSERFGFELTVPRFGDCLEELPSVPSPETMPSAEVDEDPVWLALRGEGESASLRLSTRGALLVIDDGCQRAADVTAQLLGTMPGSADPIFAADPVAPEMAYDSDDLSMRRRGKTGAQILNGRDPILDVSFFNSEAMLTARTYEERQWIRLLIAREWEYAHDDGAIGREHTLVWTLQDSAPALVMDNDYRYGSDDSGRQETDIKSERMHPHPEGLLTARGKRKSVEQESKRVPGGECPSGNGSIAFHRDVESVVWTFTPNDETRESRLGTAKREATFATACVEVATKELKRRRPGLTDRAPDGKVRWEAP